MLGSDPILFSDLLVFFFSRGSCPLILFTPSEDKHVRLIFSPLLTYNLPICQSNSQTSSSHMVFGNFGPISGPKPLFFHIFQPDKFSNCFLQASHFWGKNGAKKEPFHPWGLRDSRSKRGTYFLNNMILGGDWTLTSLMKLNNKYCTSKCLKMGGPTEECSSPIEHIDTDRPSPQYPHLLVCVSIYAFSGSLKPKLPRPSPNLRCPDAQPIPFSISFPQRPDPSHQVLERYLYAIDPAWHVTPAAGLHIGGN